MSLAPSVSSTTVTNRFAQLPSQWCVLLAACVFSVITLWWPYAQRMWAQGHYQYFPVLIAAVGALIWSRRGEIMAAATGPSARWFAVGLGGAIILALAGQLLYSGFLGMIATLALAAVLVYGWVGRGGFFAALPVLSLLVFALPLPMNLDQSLIIKMQFWASQIASTLLDGIGVRHVREGVVLITERSHFMTEEACSGIRSLFSSLAVVAAFGVGLRHRWLRIAANLVQALVWVIIGNSLRVFVVVILADHVSTWFATGAGHEIVGMLVFIFILAMVASTDALLCLITGWDRRTAAQPEVADFPQRQSQGQSYAQPQGQLHGQSRGQLQGAVAADPLSAIPLPRWVQFGAMAMMVLVGIIGLRVTSVRASGYGLRQLAELPQQTAPAEADLPAALGSWRLESFEHVQRERTSMFAAESYIWTYRLGTQAMAISVDAPWAEWHDLAVCYRGIGWDVQSDYFVTAPAAGVGRPVGESPVAGPQQRTQTVLRMAKGDRSGLVLFSVVDRQGQEIFPGWRAAAVGRWQQLPKAVGGQVLASLGFGLQDQFRLMGRQLPASTIQLLVESPAEMTEGQVAELQGLFESVREQLLAGARWQDD